MAPWILKGCEKCGGTRYREEVKGGSYITCLQCGKEDYESNSLVRQNKTPQTTKGIQPSKLESQVGRKLSSEEVRLLETLPKKRGIASK